MKKIIFMLMVLAVTLFAEVQDEYISKELLKQNIPIVDIRTPGEWKETGLLKDAIPIMFWDAKGNYDARKFLNELNKKVDTTKPFALICHTGSRTSMVAPWLAKEFGYKVINLKGGMEYATKGLHVKTVPYKK
ncbi:rhodanese-like domain-containing protein [Sulfurimonas autotrophica]|uniref:Rhodanese-like domain-containing protein n=1 Tax=Sulfurimonas autotrophica (strain ATCC BAA-671 / DSM 16294 / JCM 11897 / OK10) TaxID=563040 RepID=E0UUS7_SULAO|nr:rhodanese-like domain-containing protein [Sulfurimonas autotrophica]ADN09581.1 rhodanese-like domain-containing protein [Sulfurimonas autotrophica DSM 16294]